MLDALIGGLVDLVAGLFVPRFGARRRERARARAFADGGEVVFAACLLGDRWYCRPAVVFLAASRTALHVSPTEVKELRRRALPAAGIEILRIRGRRRSDSRLVPPFWQIAECREGEGAFQIACGPDDMRRLRAALDGAARATGRTPGGTA